MSGRSPSRHPRTGRGTARALVLEAVIVLLIPVVLGATLGWYDLNARQSETLSPVGSDAHAFLNGFPDSSMVVEIDYQSSVGPPPASEVSILEQRINATCTKSTLTVEEVPFSSSVSGVHETDLLALEQAVRQTWPSPGRAVLGYLYLGGSDLDHPNTIGLAFRGASIAVFEGTIQADAAFGAGDAVTTTVLVHEFGHELGLVGIVGSAAGEDPNHPYHSSDPNDVMYWAVDTTSIFGALAGAGPPNAFDSTDMGDLSSARVSPVFAEIAPWAVLGLTVSVGVALLWTARRRKRAHAAPA